MVKVAVITARGGSKGVPRKNLREIAGVSLLKYAILAAKKSNLFDVIVVSTDCQEISKEAVNNDAKVVIRPDFLSGDNASSFDAVAHALDFLGIDGGISCLLQPTSPLRTEEDIIAAYNIYLKNDFDSVVSICESEHHPYKSLLLKNDRYEPLVDNSFFEKPRQTLDKAYRINGAVYFSKIEKLLKEKTFFSGSVGYSLMPSDRSIDIDSEIDLIIAEKLLKGI